MRTLEWAMLLDVRKMSCNHCVRSVTGAVHALDPDARLEVDLASGTVRIDDGRVTPDAVAQAIRDEGYEVTVLQA
jgi:copper chaperone